MQLSAYILHQLIIIIRKNDFKVKKQKYSWLINGTSVIHDDRSAQKFIDQYPNKQPQLF